MDRPQSAAPLPRTLVLFLRWAALLLTCAYTFLDYWNYNRMYREDPREWADLLAGRGIAPAQYRVGVLHVANLLARVMSRIAHAQLRHGFAVIDFCCLLAGLAAVLHLLTRTERFRTAAVATQWIECLLCLTIFELYLFWIFWFQKPETMATFAFLAFSALVAAGSRRVHPAIAALLLVLMAALGATVRADAAAAFHAGMLLVCLLPMGASLPLGRVTQALASSASLITAVGVQYLIAHMLYPQAQRNVGAFQLLTNLHSAMGYLAILFSLAPYGIAVWLAARRRRELDGWSLGLLLGSLLHFALFYTLGMAEEVRIFLPYAMVVLPVSVPLLYARMLGNAPALAAAAQSSGEDLR